MYARVRVNARRLMELDKEAERREKNRLRIAAKRASGEYSSRKPKKDSFMADEIEFINNPMSEANTDFQKRLSRLYSIAIMQNNKNLFDFLETRFGERKMADKEIQVVIL